MYKKIIYLFLIFSIVSLSCKKENKKIIENQPSKSKLNDSIENIKYEMKEKLSIAFLDLPFSYNTKNPKAYDEYLVWFAKFDSLVSVYEKLSLTDRDKQLLAITKFKKSLILSDYSEAIKELENIPKSTDLDSYKTILLAIAYKLEGDSLNSNKLFKKILNEFSKSEEINIDCSKYFLTKILSDDKDISLCKDKLSLYYNMNGVDEDEIIRTYFLANTEL